MYDEHKAVPELTAIMITLDTVDPAELEKIREWLESRPKVVSVSKAHLYDPYYGGPTVYFP